MTAPELHVHEASPQERQAAFANVFEVWPQGPDLQTHLQRRNASVQHRRARWYVGVLQGQVVTSLGAYPVRLLLEGRSLPAVAIGSVHTLSQFRGRGLASQLLRQVEAALAEQGVQLALLYSDIAPEFYQRLGYQLCPAWQGWLPVASESPSESETWELRSTSWEEAAAEIRQLYGQSHARRALAYDRPAEYWEFLHRKWPQDQYLLVCEKGKPVGYARMHQVGRQAHLVDWALRPEVAPGGLARLLRLLARLGAQHGWQRVGGWLPPLEELQGVLPLQPRQQEITMLKTLHPQLALNSRHLDAAGWLLEVDHV